MRLYKACARNSVALGRRLAVWIVMSALASKAGAAQVQFQVDMSLPRLEGIFNPAVGDQVAICGKFGDKSWDPRAILTQNLNQPDLFSGTFNDPAPTGAEQEYKYIILPHGNHDRDGWIWEAGTNRLFVTQDMPLRLPMTPFDDVSLAGVSNGQPMRMDPIAGADMSLLPFFESQGKQYKEKGNAMDALVLLKKAGFNYIRLRLFTSNAQQAARDPYNFVNNLAYTLPLAVRVKKDGLKLLLDLHFSDSWADPGKQRKPDGWRNLDFQALTARVRSYSFETMKTLCVAGARPDMVQVGNEITPGMLWDDGRVRGSGASADHWDRLADLLAAAIKGLQEGSIGAMPRIMIHIDRGGDWATTRWFFDHLEQEHVPFDVIGESYYPWWHGPLRDLKRCLDNAACRYGKPVVVVETAFPWTNTFWQTNICDLPGTIEGQSQYASELGAIVASVPGHLGAGVFWWGAEYQNMGGNHEAGFDTTSLFDAEGNLVPAALELCHALGEPIPVVGLAGPDLPAPSAIH